MIEMQANASPSSIVIEEFWQQKASVRPVHLLTETNHAAGGSLVAVIGHDYLIWEAWGELDSAVIASSLAAIRKAIASAAEKNAKVSGFFDFARVVQMDEGVSHGLRALRAELGAASPLERAGMVLGSTMARISYDMASLLCPPPWEERVFPTVGEALTWLQDPSNTEVIEVDGLSWIV
jgi:hypothetical protein